jgi:class 3 adenylate cyclase/predicted ATPase
MECPKCRIDNPDNRKFCRECGEKLVKLCPSCGFENLPGDKFCGECGRSVHSPVEQLSRELSLEEKLSKMKRYLPKDLTEKILSQRDKLEGEKKQVTVMFCDMEGFTPLSEQIGLENTYGIMDQIYEILIHKVHDYEGTVNEMTGDGIMALFGAPIALEDAPQRAVRSAYAIHRELAQYNAQMRKQAKGMPSIKMRIGIHTGPVVVGTLGNDLRVEFKAVGDTVNLAARMEGLAEPGTTCVTQETFHLTEGIFRFEALGTKEIKGKKEAVRVYRVIAPSRSRTRFDISAERGLTKFVGRERELELLLDGFERAKGGMGQSFSITAEAGVGKSRLVYEFRKEVSNEEITFFEGKCLSFTRGVAYHPIIDILKQSFDVHGHDKDIVIREKVVKGLKTLGIDEASSLPYILELLSVKDSGIDKVALNPEARKAQILEALKRIVLKVSEGRFLVVVIEDLHWVDESSEEVLKVLLESISGARVLLIFTYRPEFVHTWGGRSYHCQINLNRLSNRESMSMVSNFLETGEIDGQLESFILERTEGVPFFIEEFMRSLKDLKVIGKRGNKYFAVRDLQDVTIPATIQDVIMARVDALPEAAKKTLQIGSINGREFSYELIKNVMEIPEKELLSHLSILKDSELFYERGIFPQSTYVFKHALTQDAAYQSLLKATRQKYHRKVALVLEEHFPKTVDAHPELLGHHCTEAGLIEQAITYWQKAGDMAIRRSAHVVAERHFARGIELVKTLPETIKRVQRELDLQTAYGTALMATRGFGAPEVKQALVRARELCEKAGETPQLFEILHGLWIFYLTQSELHTSLEIAEQILDIAKRIGDPASFLEAYHVLGANYFWQGEYISAQRNFEQTIAIYNSQPKSSRILLPRREDPAVICCAHLAELLWILGYPDKAVEKMDVAFDLANELVHPFSMGFALLSAALLHLFRREPRIACERAEAGVELAKEQKFVLWLAWSTSLLGAALAAQGRIEEGIAVICRGLDIHHATGTITGTVHLRILLAEVYGKAGKIKEGFSSLDEAQVVVEKNEGMFYHAELYRTRGVLLLMQDRPNEQSAEEQFRKAVQVARQKQAKSLELRAAISLSRLLMKKGNKKEALHALTEIYNWFTEGFDTADLIEAKVLLTELS